MSDEADDLLRGKASSFERAHSKTSARLLATDTDVIRRTRDPLRCSASFLPFFAAERSVHHFAGPFSDGFSSAFVGGEAFKRAAVAGAFEDHLSYGTPAALEHEIRLDVGFTVQVVEFFEAPGLRWPEFGIVAEIDPGDPYPDMGAAYRAAIRRKNVRDWPAWARIRVRQPVAALNVGAATHVTPHVVVLPVAEIPPPPQIVVGAFTRAMPRVTVLPLRPQ